MSVATPISNRRWICSAFQSAGESLGDVSEALREVVKRFEVNIVSHREGDNLILDERFLYSDGTRQRRVWTLTPEGQAAGAGAQVM